jgi:hypothetical protein
VLGEIFKFCELFVFLRFSYLFLSILVAFLSFSLCINISHLNISLLNVVSKEVVSALKVSHSLVED